MEKIQIIEKLFAYIVTYSYLLLPLAFIFFKSKNSKSYIIALYGILFFLILNFFQTLLRLIGHNIANIYTFLEYSFFALLFWQNIRSRKFRNLIIILSLGFVIFQIIYSLKASFTNIDSIPVGVESILIFIYIFYFFYEYLNSSKNQFIFNNYCFWISIGILIYLGGSFFINILAEQLDENEFNSFWKYNYLADAIKNIFFMIAIIVLSKESIIKTKENNQLPDLDMI